MDLTAAKNALRINRHRLDDELEVQAEMVFRVAEEKVRSSEKAADKKDVLARVEARLFSEIKEEDPKASNDYVQAQVVREAERIDAFKAYQVSRMEAEKWEAMYEAWRQRGFALKTLSDLYLSSYFNVEHTESGRRTGTREVSRSEEEYLKNRDRMADQRMSSGSDRPVRRRAL